MARRPSRRHALSAAFMAALLASVWLTPAMRATGMQTAAPPKIDGLWDATIVTTTATIPFRFEIATKGNAATGSFFEGDRKIDSSEGTYTGGALKLVWDHLNTTLELTGSGDRLTGSYVNRRPNSRPQAVEMKRFTPVTADATGVPQTT